MTAAGTRTPWRVLPPDPRAERLAAALGVPPLVGAVLLRRGIETEDAARDFLDPRLERLTDPETFPRMVEAVELVVQALRSGTPVAIHGDYDVDGITGTALLVRGLRALGVDPLWYLPHRIQDGYGLGVRAVEALAHRGARVLLAVDCGITAHEAVARARALGLTVVVLDHHAAPADLPPAVVVEPEAHGAEAAPCAAGLAFFFLWALRRRLELVPEVPEDLVVLAALGTVADVVSLRGDNRRLVAAGLRRIREVPLTGLRTLLEVAGVQGPVDVWHVGWQLAPRLNAPGRLGDPAPALRLLLTEDPAEAHDLAWALDRANRERQALTDRVLEEATAQAESDPHSPAVVVSGEGWHPGVVGLVAGRLVDLYGRPAVVIALEGAQGRGSARSVEGFDLVEALTLCQHHLVGFGGHALAAGLSIDRDGVEAFRRAFCAVAAERVPAARALLEADAQVALADLTADLVDQLDRLGPFGPGNPPPLLAACGLRAVARRLLGDGSHLGLTVTDGSTVAEAIGFRMGPWADLLALTESPVDVIFVPELDRSESRRVRLRLRALDVPGVAPQAVLADAGLLVDRLFARAADFLGVPSYSGAEHAPALYTKLVGVTFEDRQRAVASVRPGDRLRLRREPANPHDPHAIQVTTDDGRVLGYLNARLAGRLAPAIDRGARYRVTAAGTTGASPPLGLNVYLERVEDEEGDGGDALSRSLWRSLEGVRAIQRLGIELLGGRVLPAAWMEAWEALEAGRPVVLAVPPGRGRAQALATAAALAVRRGLRPWVVSPLRAQVLHRTDQLARRLAPFGLRAVPLHGLQGLRERQRVVARLRAGEADVVVVSVEALRALADQGEADAGALLVDGLDEGDAPLLASIGSRPLLAITGARSAGALARRLGAAMIFDYRLRPPLQVEDRRGGSGRDGIIEEVASQEEKVLVYTVRREECVRIAEALRARHGRVGYVHGGLPVALRQAVTQAFRAGRLRVLVATGAGDEEEASSDVHQVVVAELPPDRERFLAICGAAGSGAHPVTVTLAYRDEDTQAVRARLDQRLPDRTTLLAIHRALWAQRGTEPFLWPGEEVWSRLVEAVPGLSPDAVWAACAVFEELGLATRETAPGGGWQVQLRSHQGRRDLMDSLRYREGVRERKAFEAFAEWAGRARASEVLRALLA